jgi:hypothetical protein
VIIIATTNKTTGLNIAKDFRKLIFTGYTKDQKVEIAEKMIENHLSNRLVILKDLFNIVCRYPN